MSARTEAIWARMPEADRALVRESAPMYREQLIELWDAAQRTEREGRRGDIIDVETRETNQDELDEQLLSRAAKGEYGTAARDAVSECARQWVPGTNRRPFLRACRKAVEATRSERAMFERAKRAGGLRSVGE